MNEDAQIAALLDEGAADSTPDASQEIPDAAAPEAPQEEIRVVKEGDTLMGISQEVGVPLEQLARDNGIKDVNLIMPGQKIRYTKSAPLQVDTDISAEPETATEGFEDYSEGKFTGAGIDVSLEGKGDLDTAERNFTRDIVTEKAPGTYSVDITKGDTEVPISEAAQFAEGGVTEDGVALEPTAEAVEPKVAITGTEKPAIAEGEVAPVTVEAEAKPVVDQKPDEAELQNIIKNFTPTSKPAADVFNGVIEKIKGIEHETSSDAKEFYQEISDEAEAATKKIDDQIAEIAEEKIKPTFTGWNKFMAVLGAAMGAYGSAMTGSPNFALNIMNKAIDADAEQFLASKEIRTKSLLQQRQELLQRKADLLQIAINESDRMLKVAELQVKKEESVANVEAIKQQLEQEQEKTKAEFNLSVIELLSTKAAAQKVADLALSKDQRERGVKALTLKDENGDTVSMPAYLTSTVKEGEQHRESWNQTKSISGILDKIDKVAGTAGAFAPGSLSNTKTSLKNLSSQLIVHLKELYGMGANFTEFEQALVRDQTPTDGLLEQFKVWQQKSKDLRRQLIMKHQARAGSQGAGFAQMPNAAGKKKLGPGMKAGVSK